MPRIITISRRRFLRLTAVAAGALNFSRDIVGARRPGTDHPPSSGFSTQTQAFFDRLFTAPDANRAAIYADLIDSLVSAGVWDLLDCLYVLAAADHLTALTNLVGEAPRAIWPLQIGLFTPDQGVTPQGTSNYLDTGFNPSHAAHFAQNSASLFAWNMSSLPQPGSMIGGSENQISPYDNFAGNHTLWAINSASSLDAGLVAPDASGFWLTNRTGATTSVLNRNGVQLAASSGGSVRPGTTNINAASNNTCQLAVIGAGAGLSADQSDVLFGALQQYLQSIGAV
jgi:hypothetical protein